MISCKILRKIALYVCLRQWLLKSNITLLRTALLDLESYSVTFDGTYSQENVLRIAVLVKVVFILLISICYINTLSAYYLKIAIESPQGLKGKLLQTFGISGSGEVTEAIFNKSTCGPSWKRLLFSLCFFNAVIRERKKYGALGWNIPYKFSSSDLEVRGRDDNLNFIYLFVYLTDTPHFSPMGTQNDLQNSHLHGKLLWVSGGLNSNPSPTL